jgi:hypothetical protein
MAAMIFGQVPSFEVLLSYSMTARSFGTVKSGNRAPKLVAMAEIANGKDAGDGLQVFFRDAQDDSPRCGLVPQRESAWRSFRCRLLTEKCASTLRCKHTQGVRKV